VTDVVGGQIAAMFTPHGDFLANHRAGKLRILATSGKARSPFVSEVATFAEQGFAVVGSTPAEFSKIIADEIAMNKKLAARVDFTQ
jgi:tripartite-type tricarboxylate transporter receptor subunit TctC